LYTVYINVVKKQTNLNVFGMLYFNTITTLPALLVLAIWSGDWSRVWSFRHFSDPIFQFMFQSSIILAFLMNVSTFYCTTLNSARTQTVVGQLKNVVPFALGIFLFNDYIYDHINMLGLIIGFWGGIQYSWVTYRDKADSAARNAPVTVVAGGKAPVLDASASIVKETELAADASSATSPQIINAAEEGKSSINSASDALRGRLGHGTSVHPSTNVDMTTSTHISGNNVKTL
jgi:hypothetical protein